MPRGGGMFMSRCSIRRRRRRRRLERGGNKLDKEIVALVYRSESLTEEEEGEDLLSLWESLVLLFLPLFFFLTFGETPGS